MIGVFVIQIIWNVVASIGLLALYSLLHFNEVFLVIGGVFIGVIQQAIRDVCEFNRFNK